MRLFRRNSVTDQNHRAVRPWRRIAGTACSMSLLVGWAIPKAVLACMGSPPAPICAKSTFVAKTVALVVVGPSTTFVGGVVGITAFSNTVPPPPGCIPVSTTISVTLTCVPAPPMAPTGSTTISTPSPGLYGFSVPVTIPFPGFRFCTVTGTAVTLWSDGSTTTAVGDTVVCIAEQAPGHPAGTPRLDMQLLTPAVQAAHPGDQVVHRYRLTNNDPTATATLGITGDSEQASRLPSEAPPSPAGSGAGVFAISDPGTGDNFPIAFPEDILPPVTGPANYIIDDGSSENSVGLPGGSYIWLNRLNAKPQARIIDRIDVFLGSVPDGLPMSVLLYSDPNNDGNPSDAALLTRRDAVTAGGGTGIPVQVQIMPTDVGPVGKKFFVGVVMQNPGSSFPMAIDQSSNLGQSWVAGSTMSCMANVQNLGANPIPPMTTSQIGVRGNWLLQAHGRPNPPPPGCVVLPPDPIGTPVPVISRSLVLCPGESREIAIVSRSWPMCANGSCGEQRVRVTGMFSDGSITGACLGVGHLVQTSAPPTFQWPDSGRMGNVTVQSPSSLRITAAMPTHTINEGVQLANIQVQTGMPLTTALESMVLDPDRGRIVAHNTGVGPAATFVGQPFSVTCVLNIFSKQPTIQTELIALELHSAAPQLNNSYFSVNARTRVTGPAIPPTLDSFFDVFYQVSLDGITKGLHRHGRIFPESIAMQILNPTQMRVSFGGVFDPMGGLPNHISDLSVVIDPGGVATGVPIHQPPQPCPADITGNGEGVVNIDDLFAVILAWGPCPPPCPPYCAADIDHNCVVNIDDLFAIILGWGACPP
jgi:hypothetical protein